MVCPFDRRPKCAVCTIRVHCPHYLLFEQRPQRHAHLGNPRGFALKPSEPDSTGGAELELTLFGRCTRLLPVLTLALFNGAKTGLGANRDRYEIVEIAERLPGHGRRVLHLDPAAADGSTGPKPLGQPPENQDVDRRTRGPGPASRALRLDARLVAGRRTGPHRQGRGHGVGVGGGGVKKNFGKMGGGTVEQM